MDIKIAAKLTREIVEDSVFNDWSRRIRAVAAHPVGCFWKSSQVG